MMKDLSTEDGKSDKTEVVCNLYWKIYGCHQDWTGLCCKRICQLNNNPAQDQETPALNPDDGKAMYMCANLCNQQLIH